MELNVEQENESLHALTVRELRQRYLEAFGDQTRTGNRTWLIRRILWRLQAITEGDLSARARQRAAELANDADLRLSAPREPSKQTVMVTARDYTSRTASTRTRRHSGYGDSPAAEASVLGGRAGANAARELSRIPRQSP